MDIGATSLSSYLPAQFAETRALRPLPRETSGVNDTTVAANRNERENKKPTDSQSVGNTRAELEKRLVAQAREAERAELQKTDETNIGGGVQLDVEEGKRVLKVFDSKDILIYQLPPKGALQLIKSQDSAQQPQVQTSA